VRTRPAPCGSLLGVWRFAPQRIEHATAEHVGGDGERSPLGQHGAEHFKLTLGIDQVLGLNRQ